MNARSIVVGFVLSLSASLACADKPGEIHGNYGPCDNMCDSICFQGLHGEEQSDVCTVHCGDDDDCGLAFDAVPGVCTVQDGSGGLCVLPCETDAECPTHMQCAEQIQLTLDGEMPGLCMWKL